MTLIVVLDAILPRQILKVFKVEVHANLVNEHTKSITLWILLTFKILVKWVHFDRLVYVARVFAIGHFKAGLEEVWINQVDLTHKECFRIIHVMISNFFVLFLRFGSSEFDGEDFLVRTQVNEQRVCKVFVTYSG